MKTGVAILSIGLKKNRTTNGQSGVKRRVRRMSYTLPPAGYRNMTPRLQDGNPCAAGSNPAGGTNKNKVSKTYRFST